MLRLRFTLREPGRRGRYRSREWWASGYWHYWRRGREPRYLGHVAKGWWHLWTVRDEMWCWSSEVVFAIGGEDSMAQISLQLPLLGRVAAGFAVPRAWTRRWVYQRREFGIELRGLLPTVLIGFDTDMADMHSYYVERYVEKGLPLPDHVAGLRLWPGWRFQVPMVAVYRLRNRLLGPVERREEIVKVVEPVTVTLPEGDYPGKVTFTREVVRRRRWFRARRDDMNATFATDLTMPWPGKGENSYDCGDDGTSECTVRIGPGRMRDYDLGSEDVAKVVSATVERVLRYRARYGRYDWQPEAVGVLRD